MSNVWKYAAAASAVVAVYYIANQPAVAQKLPDGIVAPEPPTPRVAELYSAWLDSHDVSGPMGPEERRYLDSVIRASEMLYQSFQKSYPKLPYLPEIPQRAAWEAWWAQEQRDYSDILDGRARIKSGPTFKTWWQRRVVATRAGLFNLRERVQQKAFDGGQEITEIKARAAGDRGVVPDWSVDSLWKVYQKQYRKTQQPTEYLTWMREMVDTVYSRARNNGRSSVTLDNWYLAQQDALAKLQPATPGTALLNRLKQATEAASAPTVTTSTALESPEMGEES